MYRLPLLRPRRLPQTYSAVFVLWFGEYVAPGWRSVARAGGVRVPSPYGCLDAAVAGAAARPTGAAGAGFGLRGPCWRWIGGVAG